MEQVTKQFRANKSGRDVARRVARVAALVSDRIIARVAGGFPAQRAQVARAPRPQTPVQIHLGIHYGKPLRYILAISINSLSIYLLKPPLLYRIYYMRLMAGLLAACFIWLLARIADRGFERALNRARTQVTGMESILILTQRFLRVALVVVALLAALSVLGFNMGTALAGLAIGGRGAIRQYPWANLAVALAAQKTLENVLGGISLLMDKAVHVGNFCKIGDQLGSIEDIGLRSVKIRTLDQTVLVVPNRALAQMKFENSPLSARESLAGTPTFATSVSLISSKVRNS